VGKVYEANKKSQTTETEVVLLDIEKFSLLSAQDQVVAAVIANGELEKFLNISSGQSAMQVEEVVAGIVTTGDGFYVILQPGLKGYGLPLGLSIRSALLHANKVNKKYLPGVRVAVHRGTLSQFIDVTGRENFVGPVMNDCARLGSAKPEQAPDGFLPDTNFVISSTSAFEAFAQAYRYAAPNNSFRALGMTTSPIVVVTDKHKKKHEGMFVELSRHAAFNPPRPPDFDARVRARFNK
jgi:hypothetical protein